jgi:hypothetical protein
MKKLLVFTLAFLLILPSIVMAQTLEDVANILTYWFGFPVDMADEPKDILFYFIVPFIGIWMIILGFLRAIKIFGASKIYYPLSFVIAFSTLPTRIFTVIVSFLFGSMGVWSVILFVVMFFVGTFLYAKGWVGFKRGQAGVVSSYHNRVKDCQNKIAQCQNEISAAIAAGKSQKTIDKIVKKRKNWEEELRKAQAAMQSAVTQ